MAPVADAAIEPHPQGATEPSQQQRSTDAYHGRTYPLRRTHPPFLIHVPANLLPQPSVVIHLHGGEGNGEQSLALWKNWEERGCPHYALWQGTWEVVTLVAIGNGGSQQRDPIDEDFLLQLALLAQSRYGAAKTMLSGFSSGGGMVHQHARVPC